MLFDHSKEEKQLTSGPSQPGSSKAERRRLWPSGTRTSSLLSFNNEDCISHSEGISEESIGWHSKTKTKSV